MFGIIRAFYIVHNLGLFSSNVSAKTFSPLTSGATLFKMFCSPAAVNLVYLLFISGYKIHGCTLQDNLILKICLRNNFLKLSQNTIMVTLAGIILLVQRQLLCVFVCFSLPSTCHHQRFARIILGDDQVIIDQSCQ